MKIYVDADACPVIKIIEQVAREYNIPVTLLCDTNHILTSDYSEVMTIGAGADAVDYALIGLCKKGDIVVSQDYGVAAMAFAKKCYCIHHSGKWYTDDNIDTLLMERYIKKVERKKAKGHLKGHTRKREKDNVNFKESFANMIKMATT